MCCSYYRNAVASISVFSSANLNGFCEEGGDAIGNARTEDFLQLLDVALVSVTLIWDPKTDLITHTERETQSWTGTTPGSDNIQILILINRHVQKFVHPCTFHRLQWFVFE